MKRIVLFVEGEGEADAVPRLIKRLLTEQDAWDVVALDPDPFRVGQVQKLLKDDCHKWNGWLRASLKRGNIGGVLLLLDGDVPTIGSELFCAAEAAKLLADKAKIAGAGSTFSVAIVFARQEYESWFIAGFESIAGRQLPDGRKISPAVTVPTENIEESPRDAKGWLSKVIAGGYKPTRDQSAITDMIDIEAIRARELRSFRRLEAAVSQLVAAIREGRYVATPS